MKIATALCAYLMCGFVAAVQNSSRIIACNLKAISAAERPRYNHLTEQLRAGLRDRKDLDEGCAYTLDPKAMTLPEVAEWMSLERLCCPFLTLQLLVSGNRPAWHLSLVGPPGVKTLLQEEFPG